MDVGPQAAPTYRGLFAVRGFGRFAATTFLGRGAESMWVVAIVLFVLQKFHSPTLAGLTVFLGIAPGLLLSPLAGALLDRYGRARFILLDYTVVALSLAGIVGLSVTGRLTPPLLIPLVVIGGATGILSAGGLRSLLPLLLPRHLWDRGNAVDSMGYTLTAIIGPALAGTLVGTAGADTALFVTAIIFALGGLSIVGMNEPKTADPQNESIWRSAASGVRYVVANANLRGLAIFLLALNTGAGILVVALPVLVLQRFHSSATVVGVVLALQGAGGVISALIFGRRDSEGRERRAMVAGVLLMAGAGLLLVVAPALALVALASLAIGVAAGPMDIAIFSLRQRATDAAWFGRAFSVSMSLNFSGYPIGSVISGPLLHQSLTVALLASAALTAISGLLAMTFIPRPHPPSRGAP